MQESEPNPHGERAVLQAFESAPNSHEASGSRLVKLVEAVLDTIRGQSSVAVALRSLLADGIASYSHNSKSTPLAELVRRTREARKLTRVELSKQAGLSVRMIEHYECGLIKQSSIEPLLLAALEIPPALFEREPEALQVAVRESYIPPALIAKARKARCEPSGPLIIGYDPGGNASRCVMDAARHAMAWRRGRRLIKVETRMLLDTVQAAAWIKSIIDQDQPAKLFIDVGNSGAGIYDQLQHMGAPYSEIVEAVKFGALPLGPPPLDEQGRRSGGPLNRRAEMWMKSKQWLEHPEGVQVPDSESLQADACGPRYHYDRFGRLALERKDLMRRRGALSPDEWDAVALTFARPVT